MLEQLESYIAGMRARTIAQLERWQKRTHLKSPKMLGKGR